MVRTRGTKDSTPSKVEKAQGKRKLEGDEVEPLKIEAKQQKSESKLFLKGKVKYKYGEEDAFYGRININSRKPFIHEIENNLTSTDWQKIVDGPFGKIIKIVKQVTFSAQLVHGILMKQLETKKKWETWYGVGGKELRFSLKEYHLISGLDCSLLPKIEVKAQKNVMKNFFSGPGGHKTTISDVLERFKACREDSNYKFKLALLLIVEGLILGGDKKKLVNVEHVKLLDSMDWFYEYPWGTLGYMQLHKSLAKSLSGRMEKAQSTKSLAKQPRIPYSLQGMPIIFQIWIYEVSQIFGQSFAERLNESATPRGLRWICEVTHEHIFVESVIQSKDMELHQILVPEEAEQEMSSQCYYFSDETNDPHFDILVKKLEASKKSGRAVGKSKNQNVGISQRKDVLDPRQVMCAFTELAKTMDRIETKVDNMEKKLGRLEERFEAVNSAQTKDDNKMDEEIKTKISEDGSDDIQPSNVGEDSEKTFEDLSSPIKNQEVKDDEVERHKTTKKVSNKLRDAGNPEKTTELFSWLESDSANEHEGLSRDMLDKDFFWMLLEPQKWLNSEHMEQALILLRSFVHETTDDCKNVVVLDGFWGGHITTFWNLHSKGRSENIEKKHKLLLKYCLGSLPPNNGIAWEEGKLIYAPFNVDRKHWIALEIDLAKWLVNVYDCNVDFTKTNDLEKFLKPVTHGLPVIFKKYDPMAKQLEKYGGKPLDWIRIEGLKQDKLGGDCGVYTLKYIDVLVTKKTEIFDVEDDFVDGYRSSLAVGIWNRKWESS